MNTIIHAEGVCKDRKRAGGHGQLCEDVCAEGSGLTGARVPTERSSETVECSFMGIECLSREEKKGGRS